MGISLAVESLRELGESRAHMDSAILATSHRALRVPSLRLDPESTEPDAPRISVVAAPTSTILKDIRAGRFGLNPKDEHVFVIPPALAIDGKSFADLEFAVYYNAYVLGNIQRNRPLQVVCTKEQASLLREYLARTIEGPNWSDPNTYPFVPAEDREMLSRIKEFYAPRDRDGNVLPLEAYVQFTPFDHQGNAYIDYGAQGELRIDQITASDAVNTTLVDPHHDEILPGPKLSRAALEMPHEVLGYGVVHCQPSGRNEQIGSLRVSYLVPEMPVEPIPEDAVKAILRERYGFSVTCLGNSTGFDPEGYTTSFAVFMGGSSVLIDPSPEALTALESIGIEVPYILLTHCHQDHDGGALKRILQGKRVSLLASRVVYEEFMIKAENMLRCQENVSDIDPRTLVNFHELSLGANTPITLENGEIAHIKADWNFHPIPTNSVVFEYRGETYGHSGDTQWGPAFLQKAVADGVLTEAQGRNMLTRWFKEDGTPVCTLTHFEAGGPPIHTKASDIANALAPEHRDSVYLYHAPDTLVADEVLRKIGLYETQVIIRATPEDKTRYDEGIIQSHPYATRLRNSSEIRSRGEVLELSAGSTLLTQGDPAQNHMYFVLSGVARIEDESGATLGYRSSGTAVGDWSHLTRVPVSATVKAQTPLSVLKVDMRSLCDAKELAELREDARFLRDITPAFSAAFKRIGVPINESTALLLSLRDSVRRHELGVGEELVRQGESAEHLFVVDRGSLDAVHEVTCVEFEATRLLGDVRPGEIAGERALIPGAKRRAHLRAGSDGASVIAIKATAFKDVLLKHYPGLLNAFSINRTRR